MFYHPADVEPEELWDAFNYISGGKKYITRQDLQEKICVIKPSAWPLYEDLIGENEKVTYQGLQEYLSATEEGAFDTYLAALKFYKRDPVIPHSAPDQTDFVRWQQRHDGVLPLEELARSMVYIFGDISPEDLECLHKMADLDGDGLISTTDYKLMLEAFKNSEHFDVASVPTVEELLVAAGENPELTPPPTPDPEEEPLLSLLTNHVPARRRATDAEGPSVAIDRELVPEGLDGFGTVREDEEAEEDDTIPDTGRTGGHLSTSRSQTHSQLSFSSSLAHAGGIRAQAPSHRGSRTQLPPLPETEGRHTPGGDAARGRLGASGDRASIGAAHSLDAARSLRLAPTLPLG
ncbi:hypothetical protein PAPYR_913 [Paratrimastix pyriformis]|uniref:EF-hand domain-containing protein n=1 Tax=Paratrimastix pyriformis TaxID=342808 RepID=A0ABQ8UXK2_9EUKA|nr:hypothetical protein PAPYR_913 [Paratrimastix pyriformis]